MKKSFKSRPKSANPVQVGSSKASKNFSPKSSKPSDCELIKNDFPPICDNEHSIGECYCHLCTCGTHKCPSDLKKTTISSRSQFHTSYKQYFKKYNTKVCNIKPLPEFQQVYYPLDSLTTTQQDYTRKTLVKTEICSPKPTKSNSVKFVGKSSYSSNYNA